MAETPSFIDRGLIALKSLYHGMIVIPANRRVAERVLEFFSSGVHWARALWAPGLALTLSETLEACHAEKAGILAKETLERMRGDTIECVSTEAAITNGERGALIRALQGNRSPAGADFEAVRLLGDELSTTYLFRLAAALDKDPTLANERTARAIAAHLLDHGFSNNFLHRWCSRQIQNAASDLADIARAGAALVAEGKHSYRVYVPFDGVPENAAGPPSNYISAKQFSAWLAANALSSHSLRQNGALLLAVEARNPEAAAISAAEIVRLLDFRCALGANKTLKPLGRLWVERQNRVSGFPLAQERRSVEVRALFRENNLYALDPAAQLDSVLELLGTLKTGAPGPAVISGWAAVEALLSGAGDKDSITADRLAAIAACSYPRAELTELAYKMIAANASLAPQLNALTSNRERAELVADEIRRQSPASNLADRDQAALERISAVVESPHIEIPRLRQRFATALYRLYRHRNLVVHGGMTTAVGLQASLRVAAPIIGAGVDRIAHAWLVQGMRAPELAARANIALATVGEPGGPKVTQLLD